MFRSGHNNQISGRVIQRILIDMMHMLISGQFAFQKSLHHNAVLRLVMPISHIDISIAVFNVRTFENLRAYRLPVSFVKSVMVLAERLCDSGQVAIVNTAQSLSNSIWLFCEQRVAVFVPTLIMRPTHLSTNTRLATVVNLAKCFLSWHCLSITQGRLSANG